MAWALCSAAGLTFEQMIVVFASMGEERRVERGMERPCRMRST